MTWSEALRPPLRPPMPSATTPSTQPGDAGVADQGDLVLLVFAVTLVDAGCGGESEASGHAARLRRWRGRSIVAVERTTYYRVNASPTVGVANAPDHVGLQSSLP